MFSIITLTSYIYQNSYKRVGRTELRGMSRDGYGLRVLLGSMSADGRAVFSTGWLFGLRHSSTETYRLLSGARSPYQGSTVSASDSSQSSHRPLLCLPSAFMTPARATVASRPLQETLQDMYCDKTEKIKLGENKI